MKKKNYIIIFVVFLTFIFAFNLDFFRQKARQYLPPFIKIAVKEFVFGKKFIEIVLKKFVPTSPCELVLSK